MTENMSYVTFNVLLVGLEEMERFKYLYFVISLGIYLSNMSFCLLLVFIVWTEPSLHEPMYIFICNLITNVMFGSTAFLPKLMIDLLSGAKTISVSGCLVQAFCIQSFTCNEIFTFAAMAFDRILAVCYPLRYPTMTTTGKAVKYSAGIWTVSLLCEIVLVSLVGIFATCGTSINNVYCETMSLVKLACDFPPAQSIFGTVATLLIVIVPNCIVVFSYNNTFIVCLKLSKDEYQKAIHTLVTHLMAFSIFMGASLFVAFRYKLNIGAVSNTVQLSLAVSGLTVSIAINPIIYGLRTKAFRKKITHHLHLHLRTFARVDTVGQTAKVGTIGHVNNIGTSHGSSLHGLLGGLWSNIL